MYKVCLVDGQVWRIAFFGRLEECKGIKLFVEAVYRLQEQYNITQLSDFEVYIMGPDATINMVLSPPPPLSPYLLLPYPQQA